MLLSHKSFVAPDREKNLYYPNYAFFKIHYHNSYPIYAASRKNKNKKENSQVNQYVTKRTWARYLCLLHEGFFKFV